MATSKHTLHIAQLWIHPLKSASPIKVETSLVDRWGLQYDRIYMLVEQDKKEPYHWKSMSQKRYTKMARLCQAITKPADGGPPREFVVTDSESGSSTTLALEPDLGDGSIIIPTEMPFYPDPVRTYDMGDECAVFFTRAMKRDCRLVYRDPTRKVYGPKPEVGFLSSFWQRRYVTALTDAAPLHIITAESLDMLTEINGPEVEPERFRPNIMLRGTGEGRPNKAWDEESWKVLDFVGSGQVAVTARCPRCGVPDVDPQTGRKDPVNRPAVTLKKYHASDPSPTWGDRPMFGMWAIHLFTDKTISIGDQVEVVKRGYHEFKYP